MNWFKPKTPEYINLTPAAPGVDRIPKGLWHKCQKCGALALKKDFEANMSVCPACGRHERIGAKRRITQLVDPGSFQEFDANLIPSDPLKFDGKVSYKESIEAARKKTGLNEAVVCGTAKIGGVTVSLAVMDFFFMGGSMGAACGEKIARAMERSVELGIPCITFTSSGGARMQEGIYSLMQLPKTTLVCVQMEELGIPFISVLADPSTGGTMASFASLGDVIIAEPGAMIGFAGKIVIEQTIKQQLPADFQTAEFQKAHGFVDIVVTRHEMRDRLARLLRLLTGGEALPEKKHDSDSQVSPATMAP